MRYSLFLVLFACALGVQAIPQKGTAPRPQESSARNIPCKTDENASMCYWTHGRLSFYNGGSNYRIWKVGTKRILAVFSGPSRFPPRTDADRENPEFPANVDAVFRPPDNWIYADFEVCPLEPEHPGWMQAVCVESAKKIVLGK